MMRVQVIDFDTKALLQEVERRDEVAVGPGLKWSVNGTQRTVVGVEYVSQNCPPDWFCIKLWVR